jgi:hypothetical protein
MAECPEYQHCIEMRIAAAKESGTFSAKLENIEKTCLEIKADMKATAFDVKRIYWNVAKITGGIMVLGFIATFIFK